MKIIKFKGNILRLKSEVDVTSKEHLAKVVTQKSFAKKNVLKHSAKLTGKRLWSHLLGLQLY